MSKSKKAGTGKVAEVRALQRRLSRDEILQPQVREEEIEIIGLGGTVLVTTLSHQARQEIREDSGFGTDEWDEDRFTMLTIVRSLVDPKLSEGDIKELEAQSAGVIDEFVTKLTMLNMLGRAGDLKKGSSKIKNSDSG